jgi:hypothetical protein
MALHGSSRSSRQRSELDEPINIVCQAGMMNQTGRISARRQRFQNPPIRSSPLWAKQRSLNSTSYQLVTKANQPAVCIEESPLFALTKPFIVLASDPSRFGDRHPLRDHRNQLQHLLSIRRHLADSGHPRVLN